MSRNVSLWKKVKTRSIKTPTVLRNCPPGWLAYRKRSETVLKQFLNKWCCHVCWAPSGIRSGFPCSRINHSQYNQSIKSGVRSTAGETYWIAAIQRPRRSAFIHLPARPTHVTDIPKHEAFTPDWKLSEENPSHHLPINTNICMYISLRWQLNRYPPGSTTAVWGLRWFKCPCNVGKRYILEDRDSLRNDVHKPEPCAYFRL